MKLMLVISILTCAATTWGAVEDLQNLITESQELQQDLAEKVYKMTSENQASLDGSSFFRRLPVGEVTTTQVEIHLRSEKN